MMSNPVSLSASKVLYKIALICSVILSLPAFSQEAFDSATFNNPVSKELRILRITPKGKDVVTANRQIVFKFDQPVVAIGDMQRKADEIPISIQPEVQCEWLWLDTSSLSCQLNSETPLKAATKYSLSIEPGIKTIDGASMAVPYKHQFITQRPKLQWVRLHRWTEAARPQAILQFNQPVTRSSIVQKIQYLPANLAPIAIELRSQDNPVSEPHYSQTTPNDNFKSLSRLNLGEEGQELSEELKQELEVRSQAHEQARQRWVITPKVDLPADTDITLRVSAGVKSISGQQLGVGADAAHTFTSLPEFKYLGVECYAAGVYDELNIPPSYSTKEELRSLSPERQSLASQLECDPLNRVSLKFSTPVSYATAKQHLTVSPDLAGGLQDYDPWSARQDNYQLSYFFERRFNYRDNSPYSLILPEMLKAYEQYGLTSDEGLIDEVGRTIKSPIDMAFLTAHRAPRLWLDHRHSVLEKNIDTELPVTVTNLDELKVSAYTRTTVSEREQGLGYSKELADVEDIAYKVPAGVRDALKGGSGVIVGALGSDPLPPGYNEDYYRFVSQVTPYQVHFKFGHFNSYAWVTDLATGEPVADASVRLDTDYYASISSFGAMDDAIQTDKNGVAELPGLVEIDPQLKIFDNYRFEDQRLMLKVAKGEDMAVLPLDGPYAAWSKVRHRLRNKNSYVHAWGTTAQGIYRAGDTIQYKLYVRNQSNEHWVAADAKGYSLEVIDPKGQAVEKIEDLTLSEFGSYSGELTTSETAAVGWYQFRLTYNDSGNEILLAPMKVLVSDFTPAAFRVTTDINGDQFSANDTLRITTLANMHAGGPYADAEVRNTVILRPTQFSSKHPAAKGFYFGSGSRNARNTTVHQGTGSVDKQGELNSEIKLGDYQTHFGRLFIESAVRDDRGKYVASSSTVDYLGRDRFVGLRNTAWVHDVNKDAVIDSVVVDAKGQPVVGVDIGFNIEHQVTKAARVKGAGNAYLTQYTSEWVVAAACQVVSALVPQPCKFAPSKPGAYRIIATITDTAGRENQSQLSTWVVGEGEMIWNDGNQHQIELVADAERYQVGDVAKFLVKNPYPGAQALISVERYGVLRHWSTKLNGSTPIIEVPIEQDDYPGVYVSVVVTSPRVAMPLGDGQVDLGKPTFKMGYAKVPVVDTKKQLNVKISTDKKVYKPRDTVKLALKAKPVVGKKEQMEVAVVVLDEAVFDLNKSGEKYYDPYQGFNRLEALGVANYNLLKQLVGRQKFEKKGADVGGDGGGGEEGPDLRNLMKFVAYWNPSVVLDKRGRSKLEFELPDNLTGWRVFALAVTKEERMGLGDTNFKVNRPTELRPVMPNQLTEGDKTQAGFSVMNRTDKVRTITVEIRASGDALKTPISKIEKVSMEPYERKRIWLDVNTDQAGELAFFASAADSLDSDAIEHHVPVNKRRSLITAATYGTTTQSKVVEEVSFPDGIYSDVGGLNVSVSPSVVGNIAGAFRYLRDYPYACWEQRLSKGLAASQYGRLKKYLPADFNWDGSAAVPADTLRSAAAFQAPNGGMTYWVNKDAYVSQYLSAYTAMGFVWLHEQGYTIPEQLEERLHRYLLTLLRRDDTKDSHSAKSMHGMRSSVRALALAALSKRGKLSKQDLARYRPHLPDMDLFGKAHFLQAASALDADDSELLELSQELLSYSVQSGGKFHFNDTSFSGHESMLHSSMRTNCAVLSSFMAVTNKSQAGLSTIGDVPFKQVRAITQTRGARDYWANTQENVFCMNALVDFSKVYESEQPHMSITASFSSPDYGEQLIGNAEFTELRDPSVSLNNPELPVESSLSGEVELNKQGTGRVYYSVQMQYAKTEDNAERINAGIEIRREYSVRRNDEWKILTSPLQLEKGELVKVDLFVSAPTVRNFVVIDDPIPGGLEPVNRDLATSSSIDAGDSSLRVSPDSWWHKRPAWVRYGQYGYSFYHKELRHDSARFYSDYLPRGDYHLSYTAQAIAGGEFSVLPVKAEEMYDPDIYGLGVPASLQIEHAEQ